MAKPATDVKDLALADEGRRRIDIDIARFKLVALGVHIDTLSPEQEAYLTSWQEGT